MARRHAARAREAGTPVDLTYAAEMEARAAELERKAGEPTNPPRAPGIAAKLAIQALMTEAKAANPFIREV
jgi:hypothetical protein